MQMHLLVLRFYSQVSIILNFKIFCRLESTRVDLVRKALNHGVQLKHDYEIFKLKRLYAMLLNMSHLRGMLSLQKMYEYYIQITEH